MAFRNTATRLSTGLAFGAAAGAAGATALTVVTYLDMTWRARAASTTPQDTVEALAGRLGTDIPGDEEQKRNRVDALGALIGLGTGVAVGALAGVAHAAGLPDLPLAVSGPSLGGVAMGVSDVGMAALGVSDPRSWSRTDWLSDAVPHLAFGLVTAATLHALRAAHLKENA